jgi:hypothetical protein
MIPIRTQLEISIQAKTMFINLYEQKFGKNLFGVLPNKGIASNEYHEIKRECIAIADRYEDAALKQEFELNF